ncbi:5669_t:CDS:2, partial [Acaulospora colombiana]
VSDDVQAKEVACEPWTVRMEKAALRKSEKRTVTMTCSLTPFRSRASSSFVQAGWDSPEIIVYHFLRRGLPSSTRNCGSLATFEQKNTHSTGAWYERSIAVSTYSNIWISGWGLFPSSQLRPRVLPSCIPIPRFHHRSYKKRAILDRQLLDPLLRYNHCSSQLCISTTAAQPTLGTDH